MIPWKETVIIVLSKAIGFDGTDNNTGGVNGFDGDHGCPISEPKTRASLKTGKSLNITDNYSYMPVAA